MSIVPSPYATGAYGGFAGGYNSHMGSGVPGVPADTYYADPNTGPIAQNIGSALFGNPQMMQQRALIDSEVQRNQAQTQGLTLENDQRSRTAGAMKGLGALFTSSNPDGTTRPATPQEIQGNIGNVMQTMLTAYSNPQQASDALRMGAGLIGDKTFLGNTMMGAGGSFAGTPEGETQSQNAAYRTGTAEAGIHAGATIAAQRIASDAAMARQHDTQGYEMAHPAPLSLAAGNTVLLAPGDARATALPNANPDKTVGNLFTAPQRPYTTNQLQATLEQDKINAMPPGPEKDQAIREFVNPSVVAGEHHDATQVTVGAGHDDAHVTVGAGHDAARANSQRSPSLNPAQAAALSPTLDQVLTEKNLNLEQGARDQVLSRASQLYSSSTEPGIRGNMEGAMQRAITELQTAGAPRTDFRFNPFSRPTLGAPQGGGIVPAPAAAAPSAPPPAPTGGVPQAPPGLPPGSAYSPSRQMWKTPDGRMFDAAGRPIG